MKKIILTAAIAFMALSINAQIKNAGFENWSNLTTHVYETEMLDSHNVLNPLNGDIDNWTYNMNVGVSQTTDAYSGNYAAIIHNWYNYAQTTITYRDTVSFYPSELTGMYKYISDPFTAGILNVVVKSTTGDTIINSDWYLGPQLTWDGFTQELNPLMTTTDPADSIIIKIENSEYSCQGNVMTCNLLYLDDLSLTAGTASLQEQAFDEMRMYPNPANDNVTLQFKNLAEIKNVKVAFIDMMGQAVHQQRIDSVESVISVQQLDPGTYVIQVSADDGSTTRRSLVIQ